MDINAKVFAAFQAENREQLEALRLLVGNALAGTAVSYDDALRFAHTMKAGARVCGLNGVQELAHRLETLFAQVRDAKVPLKRELGGSITSALDAIEDDVASVAGGKPPGDLRAPLELITQALQPRPGATANPREGTKARVLAAFQCEQKEHVDGIRKILGKSVEGNGEINEVDLNEVLRFAHTLKGGARISGLPAVQALSHQLESVFGQIKGGATSFSPQVREVVSLSLNAIEDWMAELAAGRNPVEPKDAFEALDKLLGTRAGNLAGNGDGPKMEPSPSPSTSAPLPQFETVRLNAEHLDRLLRSSGQLITESLRQDQVSKALADLSADIEEIDREWESVREVSAAHLHRLSATPEFTRVLHYLEFVERQARSISRQTRQLRTLQQRSSRTIRVLGQELQQNVRQARMIPAESVFGVFRRMVRELAEDEKKKVDFRVKGLDVHVDRMVLQALKDPVMHMLRNSISHGLESAAERQASGKNAVGSVSLHVEAIGNRLTILIQDDGRGLDLARVAEVAVRKGLLTQADADARSPEELSSLIFQAGFSTARTITDLSGRGMGLSVVAEAVSRLQGEVRAVPEPGAGVGIMVSVPLSISTHRLLLVSDHEQTFAIPSSGIHRLVRMELDDIQTLEGKPVVIWEGQPVPFVNLALLLGIRSEADHTVEGNFLCVMMLKSGSRRLAVSVDAFVSEREAIIQNLDAPLAGISILGGGIALEDGSVALVLNIGELIESFKPVYAVPVAREAEARVEEKLTTVLVVDDSFTARTLEKSILEVHGYNVVVAVDGTEALSKLRSEEVDLVISDVQMPRMDGLALLQEMKRDERFARLPVILVTSMDRAEDQARGLALGADAYLVKQRFDHQTLLDTIKQLL